MQDWHRDEYGARERNMKHYQKKTFWGMHCALNLKTNTGNKNINPGEILKSREVGHKNIYYFKIRKKVFYLVK